MQMMNARLNTHISDASRCTNRILKMLLGSLTAMTVLASAAASASSLDSVGALDQSQFRELARNLGAATHYKSVSPSESLGTLGFDIGLRLSSTQIDDNLFDLASDGDFDTAEIFLPSLNLHKGLPFGLDIGASIGTVVGTDTTVLGAELRYALIDGGIATPAIGLRASYSQVNGLDDFDLNNAALELGISKGFLFFTPYAGVGVVHTRVDADDIGWSGI